MSLPNPHAVRLGGEKIAPSGGQTNRLSLSPTSSSRGAYKPNGVGYTGEMYRNNLLGTASPKTVTRRDGPRYHPLATAPRGSLSSASHAGIAAERRFHAAQMTDDMEAQNDGLIEQLHEKVLDLKQIAYGMQTQVHESNTLLDQMNAAMVTATGVLGGTMRRLKAVSSFRTRRHIWLMVLFFIVVLVVLYVLLGRR